MLEIIGSQCARKHCNYWPISIWRPKHLIIFTHYSPRLETAIRLIYHLGHQVYISSAHLH